MPKSAICVVISIWWACIDWQLWKQLSVGNTESTKTRKSAQWCRQAPWRQHSMIYELIKTECKTTHLVNSFPTASRLNGHSVTLQQDLSSSFRSGKWYDSLVSAHAKSIPSKSQENIQLLSNWLLINLSHCEKLISLNTKETRTESEN